MPEDRPDLLVFPPVLPLGGLALGFFQEWLFPLAGKLPWLREPGWRICAAILLLVGFGLIVSSLMAMMRARTAVNPRYPTLHLVETWPFTWSRNPMYLGGNLALLGLGFAFRLPWVFVLFPVLVLICHYGVVLREENYLERKFGLAYRAYKARVHRWL